MRTRTLGATGLQVSEIGLGTALFEYHPGTTTQQDVIDTVRYAVDHGVNYIDLPLLSFREAAGLALQGIRDEVLIAGHLGCCYLNGTYAVSRDVPTCRASFHDLLSKLRTDHVDILFLHNVDRDQDYATVFDEQGFLGLALQLKREGKARCLALSTHVTSIAHQAISTGKVDAVMFPINPAHDLLPGNIGYGGYFAPDSFRKLAGATPSIHRDRQELYMACFDKGIGLIAMKVYAGGTLLERGRFIGDASRAPEIRSAMSIALSETQCLSYALSQPGVSTTVPGCANLDEIKAALSYLDASAEEKDYHSIDSNALWKLAGGCVYCNHCLPCPEGINIGHMLKLLDTAERSMSRRTAAEVRMLDKSAVDCVGCGDCQERCPFGVPVIEKMERAHALFGRT